MCLCVCVCVYKFRLWGFEVLGQQGARLVPGKAKVTARTGGWGWAIRSFALVSSCQLRGGGRSAGLLRPYFRSRDNRGTVRPQIPVWDEKKGDWEIPSTFTVTTWVQFPGQETLRSQKFILNARQQRPPPPPKMRETG